MRKGYSRLMGIVAGTAFLLGCAGRPPGADFPKRVSVASTRPEQTPIGRQFEAAARDHPGDSAYRIISVGADGFAARLQMIRAAQVTLDLQYYIFQGDQSGRLLTDALLVAAERGVHLRILIDDAQTHPGDEQILRLATRPEVEIRVFNPFAYRGHNRVLRAMEFVLHGPRLDYRMHNKLLVADNAMALLGGRNIGDEYFQIDPNAQYADDDVFVAGPEVPKLSETFDGYWNSALAIPAQALPGVKPADAAMVVTRPRRGARHHRPLATDPEYMKRADDSNVFAGIISGQLPVVWAAAELVCDSPNKMDVNKGTSAARPMYEPVKRAASTASSELLMITPYFVPTSDEVQLLKDLRARNVRIRILTNSLESTNDLAAQSGYASFRLPLLKLGVEFYEVRARLGTTRGSGQTAAISSYGNFGLHGKMFVFDRQSLFIGSMNFDQRSAHLNTEIGLIIHSSALAAQLATRFEAMTQPQNAYSVIIDPAKGPARLMWRTKEDGKDIETSREPAGGAWRRLALHLLALVPLDSQL